MREEAPLHDTEELLEFQTRYAPDGWEPRGPLNSSFRIPRQLPPRHEREARRLRNLVDDGFLPPQVPGLVPGEDFHRFYLDWNDKELGYILLYACEFFKRLEAENNGRRRSGREQIAPETVTEAAAPSPGTRVNDNPGDIKAHLWNTRKNREVQEGLEAVARQRQSSTSSASRVNLKPADFVAADARFTTTTVGGKSETTVQSPDRTAELGRQARESTKREASSSFHRFNRGTEAGSSGRAASNQPAPAKPKPTAADRSASVTSAASSTSAVKVDFAIRIANELREEARAVLAAGSPGQVQVDPKVLLELCDCISRGQELRQQEVIDDKIAQDLFDHLVNIKKGFPTLRESIAAGQAASYKAKAAVSPSTAPKAAAAIPPRPDRSPL